MIVQTNKKKIEKQVLCLGFSYVVSKYNVYDDIWSYFTSGARFSGGKCYKVSENNMNYLIQNM